MARKRTHLWAILQGFEPVIRKLELVCQENMSKGSNFQDYWRQRLLPCSLVLCRLYTSLGIAQPRRDKCCADSPGTCLPRLKKNRGNLSSCNWINVKTGRLKKRQEEPAEFGLPVIRFPFLFSGSVAKRSTLASHCTHAWASTVCPQGMMIDRPLEDKPLGVGRLTVYSRIKVSSMIAGTQVTSNIPIAWFTNASITARHESYSLAVMRLLGHSTWPMEML